MISITLCEIGKATKAAIGLGAAGVGARYGARLLPEDMKQKAAETGTKAVEKVKDVGADIKEKIMSATEKLSS